ncbi:MAG: hypothetical protein A2138_24405 [Deltaproteobacteria bacterium RBG_16_71_12]|nr:MAG: hypothetical protein A2138_24405 [Deltaproteobacteria bacterium RBG_16_71_12]
MRAVYDDGKRHCDGKVKGLWSSGLVLETEVALPIGSPVALVVLSGGFDGERLGAQVAGVEKGRLLLDLLGLDTARWTLLQALVDGKPPAAALPVGPLTSVPPANVPVFILSGGEDDLGDPTGAVKVAPAPLRAPAPVAVAASEFQLPTPLGGARAAPRPPKNPVDEDSSSAFELQLVELGRAKAALEDENERLRAELQRVSALKSALEDELKEALERLDAVERSLKR